MIRIKESAYNKKKIKKKRKRKVIIIMKHVYLMTNWRIVNKSKSRRCGYNNVTQVKLKINERVS